MAVQLPPGVTVDIELPPFSNLPGQSKEQLDINDLIVAAMSTPHFPEAKKAALHLINEHVSRYRYIPPARRMNRSQRRKAAQRKTQRKKAQ